MRFVWNRESSFDGAVCMSLTRVKLTGLEIDAAIRKTLKDGFCRFPDLVPEVVLKQLHAEVRNKLDQPARKAGKEIQGVRGVTGYILTIQ